MWRRYVPMDHDDDDDDTLKQRMCTYLPTANTYTLVEGM